MMKMMKVMLNALEAPLNALLARPVLGGLLKVFLVLYSGVIAPKLPAKVLELMKNPFVKMVVLGLIVYTGTKDLPTAMLLSVAFIMTVLGLVKMETAKTVGQLVQAPIDAVQEVANDMIDGVQDLAGDAVSMVPSPVGPVLAEVHSLADDAVDATQGVLNMTLDGAQDLLAKLTGGVEDKLEKEKMPETEPEPYE